MGLATSRYLVASLIITLLTTTAIAAAWAAELRERAPFPNAVPDAEARCGPTGPVSRYDANYDDLPYTEDPASPITIYDGLNYSNWYVGQDDGFIPASSGSQFAISYSSNIRRIIAVPSQSSPHYKSQSAVSFTLNHLYIACSSGYPQDACYITLRGNYSTTTTASPKPIVTHIVYPALNSSKGFSMMKVAFDELRWNGLTSLEFTQADIDGTGVYTGLMLDDLVYDLKNC